MALKFLHSNESLSLNSLPDGLIISLTADCDSELAKTQMDYWTELQSELESQVSFFFLTDKETNTDNPVYLYDDSGEILGQVERLAGRSELGENYLVFYKKGNEVKFGDIKENPENEYNWVQVALDIANNFVDSEPQDGYYKWGQIVPETAEYLCKDCGYIVEFEAGMIFPICEVCIAGEPAGPSGPGEGYWEKV